MKRCFDCGKRRKRSAFNRNRAKPDGLDHICRECRSFRFPSKKRIEASVPLKLRPVDRGYLAAFLDGEGSVRLRGAPLQMHLEVTITNTCLPALEWVRRTVGLGNIVVHAKAASGRSQCWRWVVGAVRARRFLRAVLPHLKIKRRHAELVLAFYAAIPGYKVLKPGALLPPFNEPLASIYEELRALNRRRSHR